MDANLYELIKAACEAHWVLENLGNAKSEASEQAKRRLADAVEPYREQMENSETREKL